MRLEDLKTAKNHRPFEPFDIRTADGREIRVTHPVALSREGPDFAPVPHVILPGGDWEIINFAAIASLGIPAASPAAGTGAEGNGG